MTVPRSHFGLEARAAIRAVTTLYAAHRPGLAARLIRAIVVLVGAGYVFAGPFPASPVECLQAFPLSSLVGRIAACGSGPTVAWGFVSSTLVALLLVMAAASLVIEAVRR